MMKAEVKWEHRLMAEEAVDTGCVGYFTEIRAGMVSRLVDAVAQRLADLEATVEARVRRELVEDAWAVGVLDAWGREQRASYSVNPAMRLVTLRPLPNTDDTWREFDGETPAAARIAAARALTPSTSLPETAEKERT